MSLVKKSAMLSDQWGGAWQRPGADGVGGQGRRHTGSFSLEDRTEMGALQPLPAWPWVTGIEGKRPMEHTAQRALLWSLPACM